jgi:hypothetical protein
MTLNAVNINGGSIDFVNNIFTGAIAWSQGDIVTLSKLGFFYLLF